MAGVVLRINAQPVKLAVEAPKVVLEIGASRGPAGLGVPVSDYIANSGLFQAANAVELYGFFDLPWLEIEDTDLTLEAEHMRPLKTMAATAVTLRVPPGLGQAKIPIWNYGAGLISVDGSGGMTNGTRTGANQSAGQGAVFGLIILDDSPTGVFVLAGDIG